MQPSSLKDFLKDENINTQYAKLDADQKKRINKMVNEHGLTDLAGCLLRNHEVGFDVLTFIQAKYLINPSQVKDVIQIISDVSEEAAKCQPLEQKKSYAYYVVNNFLTKDQAQLKLGYYSEPPPDPETGKKASLIFKQETPPLDSLKNLTNLTFEQQKEIDQLARDAWLTCDQKIDLIDNLRFYNNKLQEKIDELKSTFAKYKTQLDALNSSIYEAPFKRMVLSGGGAKGVIYTGAHKALQETEIIDPVTKQKMNYLEGMEGYSGSSAGSMTAAMMAFNVSNEDYTEKMNNLDFLGLLGKPNKYGFLHHDGKPIVDNIEEVMKKSMGKHFDKIKDKQLSELIEQRKTQLTDQIKDMDKIIKKLQNESFDLSITNVDFTDSLFANRKKELKEQLELKIEQLIKDQDEMKEMQNTLNQPDYQKKLEEIFTKVHSTSRFLTFGDLKQLRAFDPKNYKDVYITAVVKNSEDPSLGTGDLVCFSTKNKESENIRIADAVRASSSYPFVFEPVTITLPNGKKVSLMDGGIKSNLPHTVFGNEFKVDVKKQDLQKEMNAKKTLALTFEKPGIANSYAAIHSEAEMTKPTFIQNLLYNKLAMGLLGLGGKVDLIEARKQNALNQKNNAHNITVLDTGKVKTLAFKKSQDRAPFLKEKGELTVKKKILDYNMPLSPEKRAALKSENIEFKLFAVNVYEHLLDKSRKGFRATSVDAYQKKAKDIFGFIKIDKADEKRESPELKKEFIGILCKYRKPERHRHAYSTHTESFKNFLVLLNDPTTPSVLKKQFAVALELTPEREKEVLSNNGKFSSKDFEGIVKTLNEGAKQAKDSSKGRGQ